MRVTEALRLPDGKYCICPRCRITLDRDFQRYCDRCGQHLDWSGHKNITAITPAEGVGR